MQPVYVKSTGETSYPLLQKVLVAFGDKIAFEDTLDQALDSLFGGDSGATAGDNNVPTGGGTGSTGGTGSAGSGTGSTGAQNNPALQQALAQAKQALADRQAALKAGDWTAYGQADARLQQALQQAIAAEGGK